MASRDDDFLSRWSRRKSEVRKGLKRKEREKTAKPASVQPAPGKAEEAGRTAGEEKQTAKAAETEAPTAETLWRERHEETVPELNTPAAKDDLEVDEEALEAFKDVDFDKLNYASDYSRFMEKDVPEAIRRRALRMLWGSNPILANIDGLNDYDEDFTDAALAVKIIGSSYKPGSGYLTDEEREASYSDEAREAGERPAGEETRRAESGDYDVEDYDVEDMDDGDQPPGEDVRTASTSAEGAEDEDGEKKKPDRDGTA